MAVAAPKPATAPLHLYYHFDSEFFMQCNLLPLLVYDECSAKGESDTSIGGTTNGSGLINHAQAKEGMAAAEQKEGNSSYRKIG